MALFATAGTRIYIGAALPAPDTDLALADFASQVWVEILNTTNIGSFGDTATSVTSDEIGRARTRKAKGTRNAGTLALVCNLNGIDPGQNALRAAQLTNQDYAFKIEYPDAPATGSNPHGTQRYFAAKVASDAENLGGPNQFAANNFSLDIDSNIVKVPAGSGS